MSGDVDRILARWRGIRNEVERVLREETAAAHRAEETALMPPLRSPLKSDETRKTVWATRNKGCLGCVNEENGGALHIEGCQFLRAVVMHEAALKAEAEAALKQEREDREGVYRERDMCVALIARLARHLGLPVGLGKHPESDKSWDPEWTTIVFVDLPSGQVSWHIHDSEVQWFDGLPTYYVPWDGHTTPEKYERVLEPGLTIENARSYNPRICGCIGNGGQICTMPPKHDPPHRGYEPVPEGRRVSWWDGGHS